MQRSKLFRTKCGTGSLPCSPGNSVIICIVACIAVNGTTAKTGNIARDRRATPTGNGKSRRRFRSRTRCGRHDKNVQGR